MTSTSKDPILVVVQLTGGNDYLNTIIPFNEGRYHDSRPSVGIPADDVLGIDGRLGFNPAMAEVKELYDAGEGCGHQRHWLPNAQPLALPQHGYLAHLRA